MPLPSGTRIGAYEIVSGIGAGGMGEVYRARDTKLHRDVAVKILPGTSLLEADRLARFRREAQVLASLNHANVAQIYGLEDAHGAPALVMELIEGPTLADRIDGPLPLDEALGIARQIVEALEAAHAQNIVHRDLKPANVKLRPDGTVKVLDFGLAKVFDAKPGASDASLATLTSPAMTRLGVVMGTAAYMSPEQARGKAVDARTDIWAFGAVLYEMIAGRRPFGGETSTDVIAAILERDPDWSWLPSATPPGIRRLLRRTLEKNPKRRLHSIADARIEIDDAIAGVEKVAEVARRAGTRAWLPTAAALVVAAAGLMGAYLAGRPQPERPNTYKFMPLAAGEDAELAPAWSPDGKSIAYTALAGSVRQVFIRSLDAAVPRQVTRAAANCDAPFWSADGTRIFFTIQNAIWSIGVAGGQAQVVVESTGGAMGAVQRNGTALALLRGGGGNRTLWTMKASGVEPVHYRTPPFPATFTRSDSIDFSPDGSKIAALVERVTDKGLVFELWIIPYPSGEPRVVPDTPPFSPVPFGTRRLSWAADGRHVLVQNEVAEHPGSHLYLIDIETGRTRAVTNGTGDEWMPSVSPDGRRVAFVSGNQDYDLMQISLDGKSIRPLLETDRTEREGTWAHTGTRFAYVTTLHGGPEIWVQSVQEQWASPILARGMADVPYWYAAERPAFSPDGQQVAYGVNIRAGDVVRHVIWISPTSGGRPVPIDLESPDHHGPSWSPDGNWIAYQRFHAGRWDLVKAPLVAGKAVRLSEAVAGGAATAWSPSGDWIATIAKGSLALVPATGGAPRVLSTPGPAAFGFSRDGAILYSVQRGVDRSVQLVSFDVSRGAQTSAVTLPVPSTAAVTGFSLHPDGKSFILSVGTGRYDIWLLEGFSVP